MLTSRYEAISSDNRPEGYQIQRRALEIDQAFQREFERTRLPDQPDFETIDRFLIEARRRAVDGWEPD